MIKETPSAQAAGAAPTTARLTAKGAKSATTAQPTAELVSKTAKCVGILSYNVIPFVANLNKQPDRVYSGGMARNAVNQSFDRSG